MTGTFELDGIVAGFEVEVITVAVVEVETGAGADAVVVNIGFGCFEYFCRPSLAT